MNTDKIDREEKENRDPVTQDIIGAAFEVHRVLGYGFLEKVYQRAMQVELQARGLKAIIEAEIRVYFKGVEVGYGFRGARVMGSSAHDAYEPRGKKVGYRSNRSDGSPRRWQLSESDCCRTSNPCQFWGLRIPDCSPT